MIRRMKARRQNEELKEFFDKLRNTQDTSNKRLINLASLFEKMKKKQVFCQLRLYKNS